MHEDEITQLFTNCKTNIFKLTKS